ncbi:MDR family oxidoreductase [Carnimonas nigrificans]|uniref:acrylyl-CoA reductase (NADPH) n=1 Tax=Carnimonas nigrificans TaxID=64323 RepID=UPI0004704BB7|nr:MDR family oxidoreductase [Carnimonas nigrificans]
MFQAIYLTQDENHATHAQLEQLEEAQLPDREVWIDVEWSTLNYKDALALTGKGKIVREFPMVPGIDLAGVVRESRSPNYSPGDRVLLNGWNVGEKYWGGLAQQARVDAHWLTPLPQGMSTHTAMALGTAGYTAMLCVQALERHGVTPESGPILVTGANGGVGTIAIMLLKKAGYRVIAATGRMGQRDALLALGASEVMDRNELNQAAPPLGKARWAGAIDSVGSHTLANVCAHTQENGAVACCGLAQGMDFPASVAPFILRGITLCGINSVTRPASERDNAWQRLAHDIDLEQLDRLTRTIALPEAIGAAEELLAGKVRGRLVVDVNR